MVSPTPPIGQTDLPTSAGVETNGTEESTDTGSVNALLRQSRIPSARLQTSVSAAETQVNYAGVTFYH